MRESRARSAHGSDPGFALVELMVVVLIVAILLAAAIPTYLGARRVAQDREAQTELRAALAGARSILADGGTYPARSSRYASTVSAMRRTEPGLHFDRWRSPALPDVIGLASSGTVMQMQMRSDSGTVFCVYDYVDHSRRGTGTWYLHGTNTCNRSGW